MGGEADERDYPQGLDPVVGGEELHEGEHQKLTWPGLLVTGGGGEPSVRFEKHAENREDMF